MQLDMFQVNSFVVVVTENLNPIKNGRFIAKHGFKCHLALLFYESVPLKTNFRLLAQPLLDN